MNVTAAHPMESGMGIPRAVSNAESSPVAFVATRRERHLSDRIFLWVLRGSAISVVSLLGLIGLFLLVGAWPAIQKFSLGFLTGSIWDPVAENFGALPVAFGTVVSSCLGMAIAMPISVGAALFLNEMAPSLLRRVVGFLVEMLAAIPSVVYGLWGIFVLAPWLREVVQPFLGKWLGFLPFFKGPAYGVGMLAAGVILSIMVMPTVASIAREVFASIPRAQREAALALGATRWEMIRIAVLKSAKSGIMGAALLGFGRAVGETMAVTMVIGNRAEISPSLFAPSQTMASVIANEYAEAVTSLHVSALLEVALLLFFVTFLMNGFARLLIWRVAGSRKGLV